MKLTSCRVTNYRSIKDSGWVDIDDIVVIVGKNESGKTSFLKALSKFNPFDTSVKYDIDREWPSSRRKEKSPDSIVVETKFTFTDSEIAEIKEIDVSAKNITGVEIIRKYSGKYEYRFVPDNLDQDKDVKPMYDFVKDGLVLNIEGFSDHFISQYTSRLENIDEDLNSSSSTSEFERYILDLKSELHDYVDPVEPDEEALESLNEKLDLLIQELSIVPPETATEYVRRRMPAFIYMDDHRAFAGSAQLDEVLKHQKDGKLSAEEETILVIMEMSGLDLRDEVAKGQKPDRDQRMLDMNDASHTLTDLISVRWSQRKYEVIFQTDGQHFMTFVKDETDKALVPLEDRSKGFQWFFSFDMRFMYETNGKFENSIILLDEPGLHLHASAQRDLLIRMKDYAKKNQLIYTTHLPFMIDFSRLDNIYVAEDSEGERVKVHKNWATADKDARFTLQAALGLSWSQSLFIGQKNLVVEGVDDFWFLMVFSEMFAEAGQKGLETGLVVTPAGGASKVAYLSTLLKGQDLNVAVLLDSDLAGKQASDQLVHSWILNEKLVVMVGDAIKTNPCALEDLFGEAYYLEKVIEAYSKEIKKKTLILDSLTAGKKCLVERVEDAFSKMGLGAFNKGRVAKRIMTEMGKKQLNECDPETVAKFRKLIDAINSVVSTWK